MKVVILAGGLAPESPKRPTRRKPMVEIGGMSDVTLHLAGNRMEVNRETTEPWRGHAGRYRRQHPDRRQAEAAMWRMSRFLR